MTPLERMLADDPGRMVTVHFVAGELKKRAWEVRLDLERFYNIAPHPHLDALPVRTWREVLSVTERAEAK